MQENEIVAFVLGVGVLIFGCVNYSRLKLMPKYGILIVAFFVALAGSFLTNIESFFWNDLFQVLEHVCYAGTSILLAVWCWKVFGGEKVRQ
jgi:flagellar biosynthesis protein FliQ